MTTDIYIPELLQDLANVRLTLLDGGDIAGAAQLLTAIDVLRDAWNGDDLVWDPERVS